MIFCGDVGVDGELIAVKSVGRRQHEVDAGNDPAEPEQVEGQMKWFFEQPVCVGVLEVLEGDEQPDQGDYQECGTDDAEDFAGEFFCREV